ncbi:biotin-dependent carboxyltransferase family protein [Aquimarina spinulae]|uniref:5-oxoprolinase subunit C family protein n=1 Tax=Aquimarina spinulae TaxID=1192023 RepID=UPI000D54E0EA|nr:biotin-dependent carboxyltransferase family protein [Aquimarina spinulae]
MIADVEIVKPGLSTTIQDEGRFGFSKYGVPKSGAMDQVSFGFANLILGNPKNSACIEWTIQPPVLKFHEETTIVLTGGETDAFLNDKKIEMYREIRVLKNDILKVNFCKKGIYGYVGIKGGFFSEEVLCSRSFYKSITPRFRLDKNDKIPYQSSSDYRDHFSTISPPLFLGNSNELEVYKGPEFDMLNDAQKSKVLESVFTISNTINRMAIQLEEKIPNILSSIITSPVLPGTIQLTPSGSLIVLMRDCQTTGGYPRVLQLTETAINHIAQKRMKEKCSFKLIEF